MVDDDRNDVGLGGLWNPLLYSSSESSSRRGWDCLRGDGGMEGMTCVKRRVRGGKLLFFDCGIESRFGVLFVLFSVAMTRRRGQTAFEAFGTLS